MGHVHIHGAVALLGILRPLGKVHDGSPVLGQIGSKRTVALCGIGFRALQEVGGCIGIGQAVFNDLAPDHNGGKQILIAHNNLLLEIL